MSEWVLNKIKKLDSIEEKKKEIVELIRVLEEHFPDGAYNPPIWFYQTSKSEIEDYLEKGKLFYRDLKKIFDGDVPPELSKLSEEFDINSMHTKSFLKIPSYETRSKFHLCEFFPYYPDFDGKVKKYLQNGRSKINLENLTVTKEIISKGGFGEIYKVKEGDELKYALKLFKPKFFFNPDLDLHYWNNNLNLIINNVSSFFQNTLDDSLIDIKSIAGHSYYSDDWLYLMDYFPGKTVRDLVDEKDLFINSRELKGKVLLDYAEMLNSIHTKNYVFIDNSLSSILVDDSGRTKIIDIDFLTPKTNLTDERYYPYHPEYVSREQLLLHAPSFSGDLESFSLMSHHLIFGEPFLRKDNDSRRINEKMAGENKRVYPKEFSDKLPKNLREVIPALITYPRDDSVTAKDFISSIEKDFFG